jgi:hypothetical protein
MSSHRLHLLVVLATIASSNRAQIWVNSIFGLFFFILIPVALITGLKKSVPFLVFLSLWALVAAHWSGAIAAKAAQQAVDATEAAAADAQDSFDD